MVGFSVGSGERIEDATAFEVRVGGSEANVAYALARVGLSASWASVLPRNPLGRRVAATLRSGGIDLTPVVWVDEGRVGIFFIEPGSTPRPTSVTYDRTGSAMAIAEPSSFDWELITNARHLHVSGITFAISPAAARVAETAIREARARGCSVSLDVNHRDRLWTPDEAAQRLGALSGSLDLLICKGSDAEKFFV